MSTTVLVSSLPGIHQNSNLVTGGGTDDTAIIQTALNGANNGTYPNGLILIQDGVSLVTGLNIGSNTVLKCTSTAQGFYLANASNRELLRNVNRSATVRTDTNIILDGGTYNANKANQSGVSQVDNTPMNGLAFYGISDLTIKNLTVTLAACWEIGIGNFINVIVDNCSLTASTSIANLNTDGIDLRGPGSAATLTNLTILSGDDGIALNGRNYGTPITGPFIGGGPISNVKIDTINFTTSWGAIDLITDNVSAISDIYISNISGAVQNYAVYINRDLFNAPVPTTGNYHNINVVNNSITQSGTPFGSLVPVGLLLLDGATTSVWMSGTVLNSQAVTIPTSAGVIQSLMLNGVQRGPITGPTSTGVFLLQAAQVAPVPSGTSIAKAYPNATQKGTTLVAFATGFFAGGVTASIADTIGNVWTPQASFTDGATGHVATLWTCVNAAAGANTVTVSFNASTSGCTLLVAEYPASTIDVVSALLFDVAAETTVTAPSITTTSPNEIVLGIGSTAPTGGSAAAGYNLRLAGNPGLGFLEDSLQVAAGAYAPSWTQASNAGNYRVSMALKPTQPIIIPPLFSPADTRNFGGFPNHWRNVQGTQTYDATAVPSAPAPVDSRTSGNIPVDSRTPGNIPTNSRTN